MLYNLTGNFPSQVTEISCGVTSMLDARVWNEICLDEFQKVITHLSSTPSMFPISPGPVSAAHRNRDIVALSHGMRLSTSSRLEAQDHIFIVIIGCLDIVGRLKPISVLEMSVVSSIFDSVDLFIFVIFAVREGKDEAVAKVTIINRTAVNARNPYWRTSQNVFSTDLLILHILVFPLKSGRLMPIRSEFDRSTRTCALDFGSWALMASAIFVIPSHSSHGSETFPPILFPMIMSENI